MKTGVATLLALAVGIACSYDAATAQLACDAPAGGADRPSPYAELSGSVGGSALMVCYSRPSARGRTMIGGSNVPFGSPWRLGANEATVIHLSFPAEIAGVSVDPGSYSLWAVPGESSWEIHVNEQADRWGIPINASVRSADVGMGSAAPTALDEHVETMTFTLESTGENSADLILDWETTRVRIPIEKR